MFFGGRNKSITDKPACFAHPNSATRFSAVWVRDSLAMRALLRDLGVSLTAASACDVIAPVREIVGALPEGNIYLVPSARANVVAARIEVRSLAGLEALLKRNHISVRTDDACDPGALWIPPMNAHGIWLEFVQPKQRKTPKGSVANAHV
jgi:hypothetical protein